jgi:hypothetical protein
MGALDANGDVIVESASAAPRRTNLADRDYFQVHTRDAGVGLLLQVLSASAFPAPSSPKA